MNSSRYGRLREVCIIALTILTFTEAASAIEPYVAVTAVVEHVRLDAVRDGVRDRLTAAGLIVGQSLRFEYHTADANPARVAEIADEIAAAEPDVIVAISTPSATAAVAATNEIPIVFAAVEDSAVTGLLTEQHTNVTGLSHGMPLVEHFELVREIIPEAQVIGVLHGPVSEGSDNMLDELNTTALQYGFEIVAMPVHDENELVNAVQGMIGSTDAILLLGEDDTAAAALDKVIRMAGKAELPVFATNADLVAGGAVASVTLDFYDLGWQAGEMVWRILEGELPTGIDSHRAKASNLIVNPSAAETMGIGLPPSVIARAGIIIR